MGKIQDIYREIEPFDIRGAYLHFTPNQCLYSKQIDITYPFWGETLTGIFKYHGKFYIYIIEERISLEDINLNEKIIYIQLHRNNGSTNSKFYSISTKARKK